MIILIGAWAFCLLLLSIGLLENKNNFQNGNVRLAMYLVSLLMLLALLKIWEISA